MDEIDLYLKWTKEWGFVPKAIEAACAEMVGGDPSFKYLDSILRGVQERGNRKATTAEQLTRQLTREKDEAGQIREVLRAAGLAANANQDMVREVYHAMSQVMKDMDVAKLLSLIKAALPYGATNLSGADMISYGSAVLGGDAMKNLLSGGSVLEQLRVPLEGTWKYGGDASKSMVVFRSNDRLKENIEAIQTFIYGQSYYKK